MKVELIIEADGWKDLPLALLAQAALGATLDELGLTTRSFLLSMLASDDARIAELNAAFRGKPEPTNVLSWPAEDHTALRPGDMPALPRLPEDGGGIEIGDIALAFETCATEARDANKSLQDHTTHLIVHGILHCFGFDHANDLDATLMEGLETSILASLGVADPY